MNHSKPYSLVLISAFAASALAAQPPDIVLKLQAKDALVAQR
jgi:hypothetical protein